MKSNLQNWHALKIFSESIDPIVFTKTEQHLVGSIPRQHWISVAAHYKAKARKLKLGKKMNHWLDFENDFSAMLIAKYLSVSNEDGGITIAGLQLLAKSIGVQNSEGMDLEIELIQAIQNIRQHCSCFRSEIRMLCRRMGCEWRDECKRMIAVWCR